MIFIDTGAFVARYIQRDQYHQDAVKGWRLLEERRLRCVTSPLILSEAITLLARRGGYAFAAQRGRALFSSEALTILRASQEDEAAALDVMEKFADQAVSFTDGVSFVLMRTHHLQEVFSFDRHFERAGFHLWNE